MCDIWFSSAISIIIIIIVAIGGKDCDPEYPAFELGSSSIAPTSLVVSSYGGAQR
jgi:hypothetical protein